MEFVAVRRDYLTLKVFTLRYVNDLRGRVLCPEFIAYSERRIYMTARAASGKYYLHCSSVLRFFETFRTSPIAIMNDHIDVPP